MTRRLERASVETVREDHLGLDFASANVRGGTGDARCAALIGV
jgi:hypothetical protein